MHRDNVIRETPNPHAANHDFETWSRWYACIAKATEVLIDALRKDAWVECIVADRHVSR